MSFTSSPLHSMSWAILLGLAAAGATSPTSRPILRVGTMSCPSSGRGMMGSAELSMPANKCLRVKDLNGGTGARAVEVLSWPLCADDSPAQMAVYGSGSFGCGPQNDGMRALLNKDDVGTCIDMKGAVSIKFECSGTQTILEVESEGVDALKKDKTREGGMLKYAGSMCSRRHEKPEPEYHLPDTCVDINEGRGLSFTQPAICANGTNALIAGFKGKDCDPTSEPLDQPFTTWTNMIIGFCVPTEGINSMAFWCDGLEGVDMRKPNPPKEAPSSSNLGLILGLSLGLGGLFVIILGLVVAYTINYDFRTKVKGLFGSGDGHIAL